MKQSTADYWVINGIANNIIWANNITLENNESRKALRFKDLGIEPDNYDLNVKINFYTHFGTR